VSGESKKSLPTSSVEVSLPSFRVTLCDRCIAIHRKFDPHMHLTRWVPIVLGIVHGQTIDWMLATLGAMCRIMLVCTPGDTMLFRTLLFFENQRIDSFPGELTWI
jgi:hypothetical protein